MQPAFRDGDTVLVNRLTYFLTMPNVGDVVVLKRDLPRHGKAGKYIIKRITKIRKKEVFVVGDNESESTDSRNFGWVSRKAILGKVIYRLSS